MYWLTGSAPAKSAITLPVIKITLHPSPGFKLYTDAEKPLSLFRTPNQATSAIHKELFVTILILQELNLIFQTVQKPTHFATLTVFIIHSMQNSPSSEATDPSVGQEIYRVLSYSKVHFCGHNSPTPFPVLRRINPVQERPSHPTA
jgi:hypothetical protein